MTTPIKAPHGDALAFRVGRYTKDWFDECFTNPVTREPYSLPADIRRAAERIITAYAIKGICDPMWVANVIARETGRGDGESNFHDLKEDT